MDKTIDFALNKFPSIPNELRGNPAINAADTEFVVDLSRLFHHYYTDSYGITPPDPNAANFEYLRFLSPTRDFRFLGNGPGASVGKKRNVSMDLGQAFCRYFLYEFCGVTYFAHMDKVLDKSTHPAFNGLKVKRIQNGDAPDYLCARNVNNALIAEAKGRYHSLSFSNNEFQSFRDQFDRIVVTDRYNVPKKVKGYIVATKFSTDLNRVSNRSKVLAEDPETQGDENLGDNFGLARVCISIHYSRLVSKLGLGLWSASLQDGFTVPEQLSFTLPIWRCNYEPLKGMTFVGGYFADEEIQFTKTSDQSYMFYPKILKLDNQFPSFYGVSEAVISQLRKICLGNWNSLSEIPLLPDTSYRPSNLAWLRDGSISGSIDFFEFVGTQTF